MDSAWPQLFNDVSNLTLWYFLLLTLDFAWKFNLSNFLQVSNFGIYMTWSFQWSTTLDYTCFYIVLNLTFWRWLFAHYVYRYIYLMGSIQNLYLVHNFFNFDMSEMLEQHLNIYWSCFKMGHRQTEPQITLNVEVPAYKYAAPKKMSVPLKYYW